MKKPLGPEDVVEALRERIKKEDLTLNRLRLRQRRAARMGRTGRTAAPFGIGSIVPSSPKSVLVL